MNSRVHPKPHKRPLLLEQLFAGRAFRSDAPLFRLPAELLQTIVDEMYIEETISSLSLVSRDCYEIARAHQWHELSFGPSIIFSRLARRLLSDISGIDGIPKTSLPSLGHVVRSVQVYAAAINPPSKQNFGRRPRQTHVGQQSLALHYHRPWQDKEREDVLLTHCAIRDELVV